MWPRWASRYFPSPLLPLSTLPATHSNFLRALLFENWKSLGPFKILQKAGNDGLKPSWIFANSRSSFACHLEKSSECHSSCCEDCYFSGSFNLSSF